MMVAISTLEVFGSSTEKPHDDDMMLSTVNFIYSGQCRDLALVSSLVRVRNSGSLFQSNICNIFWPGI